MKKVLAIAFISVLAVSCSKKENALQDSNVMLEEPKVEIKDTANAKPAEASATTPTPPTAPKAEVPAPPKIEPAKAK